MSVIVPQSIKRADAIVTVSQSAKNDIVKFYNVHPDKITVTHLWTDEKYKPLELNEEEKVIYKKEIRSYLTNLFCMLELLKKEKTF